MPSFTLSTELKVTPQAFWQQMSMAAVNAELRPLVRMTAPAAWRDCPLDQWHSGRVLFRSLVLLFGCLPVDVHSLRLESISAGHGFLERSTSWGNRQWQHERLTTPTAAGCIVTDTVTVVGRIRLITALLMPVYRLVFRHRHRQLRRLHGAANADTSP
ncbi:hypothetical protein [Ideonella sp. BN130291]|uniref:hypothetical protein n=1 Tax=Ideonella sp. BN130291 TaxID=3112940 RepID=UPI002E2614EB|nr:hypothetical protein [Ideonella sp. BN130291]